MAELTPQALYERGLGAALLWLGDQMRRQQILNVEMCLDEADLKRLHRQAALVSDLEAFRSQQLREHLVDFERRDKELGA